MKRKVLSLILCLAMTVCCAPRQAPTATDWSCRWTAATWPVNGFNLIPKKGLRHIAGGPFFAVCGEHASSTHLLAAPNDHPLSGPQRRSHAQFAAAPSSGRPPGAKHSSQTVQPQKRAEGKYLRLLRLFSAFWEGSYECCCKKRCTSSRSGMEPAAPRRVTARAAAAAACRMASAGESF